MAEPTFWGGALALGVLAAAWRQVRAVAHRIAGLAIVRVRIEEGQGALAQAVLGHLWRKCPPTRCGDREYKGWHGHVRSVNAVRLIACETVGRESMLFWHGRWPVLASLSYDETRSGSINQPAFRVLSLSFLRGTLDADQLIIQAVREADERFEDQHRSGNLETSRFRIFRFVGRNEFIREERELNPGSPSSQGAENEAHANRPLNYSWSDIGPPLPRHGKALDIVALSDEAREAVDDVRRWHEGQDWYRERDIPWRYGLLLYGLPGNGKTMLAGALGRDLDMPIGAFDLASLSNKQFLESWERFLPQAPAIALFEDIDAVFDGRENVAGERGGGLTFDCFLNALGGVQEASGILIIVTTNRPETLDSALASVGDGPVSRPGRIDRAIEFRPPDEAGRRQIARRILCDCPELIESIVADGDGLSGAQFQDLCRQVALERFWGQRNGRLVHA